MKSNMPYFVENGVKRIGLFGSYARSDQHQESDIDMLVEMPPNYDCLCRVWDRLEDATEIKVDLIRIGPHLNEQFLTTINKDILFA